jgi:two-component system, NarL family, sensor histidine kinase UhpB
MHELPRENFPIFPIAPQKYGLALFDRYNPFRMRGSRAMRRWRPGLNLRLMLLITALIALFCLSAGTYIVNRAQDDIRGEVYSATELIERYLEAQLKLTRNAWSLGGDAVPNLRLAQLRDVRHVEVYFYNAVGTLLESSAADRSHALAAPFWFVWLVQHSFTAIPDVRRFVDFDGFAGGVLVIHPDPAYETDEIWNVTRGLLGLLIVFSLLVNVFVWWAVGRALRPLEHVRVALKELSAGRLDARLPVFRLPELAGLSDEFNHMARTLEQSTLENHRLTRRLIQVQDEERERLARELHDEIGQCVTAIHADAFTIHRAGGATDPVILESANAIIEITTRIKGMVRGMLQRLRPTLIDRLGLEAALRELESAFRQRNPHTVCTMDVDPSASELKGDPAMAIYRIVQEAMTNVTRHAHAGRLSIQVSGQAELTTTVKDDGHGFDTGKITEGFGLLGMRERVLGLGGKLKIESAAGRGTAIFVELPCRT